MTQSTGKRSHHFKHTLPKDPAITPFAEWPIPNRSLHHAFYHWLKSGGYSPSVLNTYSVAARLALGYLNKLHWKIDPEADFELVRRYIEKHYTSPSTRIEYNKGLRKLVEYIYFRQNKAARPKNIHWEYYLKGLPDWLCEYVHEFIAHKQKYWRAEDRYRCSMGTLSPLCQILRWMARPILLKGINEITPQLWFDYLDLRMQNGISLNTINTQLSCLKAFLLFLNEQGVSICQRMLLVDALQAGSRIPKDAPVSHLKLLLLEIEREAQAGHASLRRMGALDRAWVHLMLYSGLRTCEVRRLLVSDVDWENRRTRIEQSKGLKDRMVYMNSITVQALNTWLEVRGTPEQFADHVFIYRHQPLSRRYCQVRLRTYGKRCGVTITPHQLRHSCATLLLNAGAPVLSVQSLLGHEKVDTTLGYARLYDGTVAADYYSAMNHIEGLFKLPGSRKISISTPAELVALLDSLGRGTLNAIQRETVHALREGILSLSRREEVKILSF